MNAACGFGIETDEAQSSDLYFMKTSWRVHVFVCLCISMFLLSNTAPEKDCPLRPRQTQPHSAAPLLFCHFQARFRDTWMIFNGSHSSILMLSHDIYLVFCLLFCDNEAAPWLSFISVSLGESTSSSLVWESKFSRKIYGSRPFSWNFFEAKLPQVASSCSWTLSLQCISLSSLPYLLFPFFADVLDCVSPETVSIHKTHWNSMKLIETRWNSLKLRSSRIRHTYCICCDLAGLRCAEDLCAGDMFFVCTSF